ncbi:YwiC-like family protein [Evansella tamaricis]|uniref:YwiC-like family protein n=1 Tax=Evansella tamaricis TaxID=2069301 RepID=A0ABS6JI88_9BACI|nr:YwiC-like family protein [Evansella tamaricis]MBU9713253.1 YwiC-like family protein [Evansella tamaricis]
MKWYIPREHGAWAMLVVPYWIGAFESGVQWLHLVLFIGLFAIYFAQAPLLTYIRNRKYKDVWPSFFTYLAIGCLFTIPILFLHPIILIICLLIFPLFMVNLFFAKIKRERLFINDFVAIAALSSLLFLSYSLTGSSIDETSIQLWMLCILFFTASVFHVKSLIREKGNRLFHRTSFIYHLIIVLVATLIHWYGAAIVFLLTFLKTVFVPKKYVQKPIQIGTIEIVNSTVFFIIIVLFR